MNFAIYSVEGEKRVTNEDFVIADAKNGIFIVCDGMGGHAAGEYASSQTGKFLLDYLLKHLNGDLTQSQIVDVLEKAVEKVNQYIYDLSRQNVDYKGMGTTALVVIIKAEHLYICHVGDSRAYAIDRYRAKLLTHDQSYVQKLVDEGQITREQARAHPKKNIVLQAVGGDEILTPELLVLEYDKEQVLLLCSDGISDVLTESDIYDTVSVSENCQEAAKRLVEEAFSRGSQDDSSAVVIGHLPLNNNKVSL